MAHKKMLAALGGVDQPLIDTIECIRGDQAALINDPAIIAKGVALIRQTLDNVFGSWAYGYIIACDNYLSKYAEYESVVQAGKDGITNSVNGLNEALPKLKSEIDYFEKLTTRKLRWLRSTPQ